MDALVSCRKGRAARDYGCMDRSVGDPVQVTTCTVTYLELRKLRTGFKRTYNHQGKTSTYGGLLLELLCHVIMNVATVLLVCEKEFSNVSKLYLFVCLFINVSTETKI